MGAAGVMDAAAVKFRFGIVKIGNNIPYFTICDFRQKTEYLLMRMLLLYFIMFLLEHWAVSARANAMGGGCGSATGD